MNKDFEKVLKTLAKLAAAGEDGMSISPLRNLDRKGGAYVIMLQQFRRALGVTVVRGMAKHKLSRLHCYVRGTVRRRLSILPRPIIITIDGKLGNGEVVGIFWSYHTPPGYAEQFRNGNYCGTLFRSVHTQYSWIPPGFDINMKGR